MPAGLPIGFPPPTEDGIIELKFYPEYRAVTYTHTGQPQYATRAAFDPLYQHISSNQIAMTTPVEARYLEQKTAVEVSFLYPNSNINPQTIDPNVKVTDYPAMTVISAGIQGAYSWENYQSTLQELQNWLHQHPEYNIVGPPRRLLYNSPMTPEPMKRSEVQIPVELMQ
ncbi:heme-binding protein [Ancylothrix sp. C2]|uniref:heme-binding protein n=1 Tax=Ancylothrix sp. D3o TaxID=2953691 RepID=UPI0021BA40E8|nr:heme-binding protein [Ancylothrix sp. D3o]MCT7952271.1 heme-binding protein [Ancylothrix sp. D3o]